MPKKTINFNNPKIFDDFNDKIVSKYGSVRTYRTKVIEDWMTEYTNGTYDKNKKELSKLKDEIDELQSDNHRLNEYNKELELEVKNKSITIDNKDDYLKNIQSENNELSLNIKHLQQSLQEKESIISELKEELKAKDQELKSKDNRYVHLEEVRNKDLRERDTLNKKIEKYSYLIGYISNMSLLDRILKKYPDDMKELPPTNND